MTPRPPALVTAAASFGPAATFIPASMTGWLILRRSVTVVRSCSGRILVSDLWWGEGGKHPRFDVRGEAILCGRYVTDGRESLDLSRMKQDLLCGKERKKRSEMTNVEVRVMKQLTRRNGMPRYLFAGPTLPYWRYSTLEPRPCLLYCEVLVTEKVK